MAEPLEQEPLALVNGMKPHFDFSELSWGDSIDLVETQQQIVAITVDKTVNAQPGELVALLNRMHTYLATVTLDVPRTWLVKRAPEGLDWSKADSFRWLKQARFQALLAAMMQAQAAEKNE